MRRGGVLELAAAALFILSCADYKLPEAENEDNEASRSELEAEIVALIGTPTCSDFSECASIGFGAKPCGGHWRYLVYSRTVTDEQELTEAVEEYNELDLEYNLLQRIVSDCGFISPPALACVDGACAAVSYPCSLPCSPGGIEQ
jgi:hypothetical protein